jgi:hypothetical protein
LRLVSSTRADKGPCVNVVIFIQRMNSCKKKTKGKIYSILNERLYSTHGRIIYAVADELGDALLGQTQLLTYLATVDISVLFAGE